MWNGLDVVPQAVVQSQRWADLKTILDICADLRRTRSVPWRGCRNIYYRQAIVDEIIERIELHEREVRAIRIDLNSVDGGSPLDRVTSLYQTHVVTDLKSVVVCQKISLCSRINRQARNHRVWKGHARIYIACPPLHSC